MLLERLTEAAEKLAAAADKSAELMGAIVDQLDQIRKEVTVISGETP